MNAEVDIRASSTIVILGKRNTGKSCMGKFVLNRLVAQGKVDIVYLFSTTESLSHSFDCLPPAFVIGGLNMKFIQRVLDSQMKAIRSKKLGKDDPSIKKLLFVMDDLLGSVRQGSAEQQLLDRLFCCSRHSNIGLMLLAQSARGLFSPTLRNNVDYLMVRQLNDNQLPSIYETVYYPGTYREFVRFYKEATEADSYAFLAYDNLTRENQRFFLMTAEHPCVFKIEIRGPKKDNRIKHK